MSADSNILSYSKICKLDRVMRGEPEGLPVKEETLEAGRQFETAALQPELYDIEKDPFAANTRRMLVSVQQNEYFKHQLRSEGGKAQHTYYWRCKHTGFNCQAKLDHKNLVSGMDLKTTSAATQAEFEAHAIAYHYDIQAAFYLDGSKLSTFIILGVQKKYPYQTFTMYYNNLSPFVIEGRKKYITIINNATKLNLLTNDTFTATTEQ